MRSLLVVTLFILWAGVPGWAQELRAGIAKVDVTPKGPVMMGGYSLRNAPSDGVWDPIFVHALVFEISGQRLLFIESEVPGIRGIDIFRQKASDATGIPVANILIGHSHDHAMASPDAEAKTDFDRQFMDGLVQAAKQAVANLQSAYIAAGTGHSRIAMNRRKAIPADIDTPITFDENNQSQSFGTRKTDHPILVHEFEGVRRLGANPMGSIDDAVEIVRVDTTAGRPLAVMVHYACHGTSLGGRNSKVSGEWMGRMQLYIEKQIPGVGALYLQGAAGDINPRHVGGLDGYVDDINTTWALGEEIGREVVRVYNTLKPAPLANPRFQVETAVILCPNSYRNLFDDFSQTTVKVPTTVVRMGDMMWTTFPGEMFHNIGIKVKEASPATYAHLMGYTNGSVGYFPEQSAYSEGGYEVSRTRFDPQSERIYLKAIAALMERFR
jgi:hypothetical protein